MLIVLLVWMFTSNPILHLQFQKLKDAIAIHNTARCSIGPPVGVGYVELLDSASQQGKPAEASPR
jgi:hypothetical protein